MTDSERWLWMAEELRKVGKIEYGLCRFFFGMWWADVIDDGTFNRMIDQLYSYRSQLPGVSLTSGYFWPEGELAPRIAACEKLAELTRAEARKETT